MTTLSFEKFKIKGANLGEASCLPDIKNDDYIRAPLTVLPEVTAEEKKTYGKRYDSHAPSSYGTE